MNRVFWAFMMGVALMAGCNSGEQGAPRAEEAGSATQGASTLQDDISPVRVAFVSNNASDFWQIARAGTDKAAEEFGVEVEFRLPSAGTAEQQMQIVQDLITTGVSGIAISPKDPQNQTGMLNDAAAQVNLITQDSDAPESDRLCYIGTDNFEAGRQAGQLVQRACPAGSEVMVFVGTMDAQNARDRFDGLKQVLQETGHVIVDVRTDETDRVKAVANVQDALLTHPELDCLVGLWSYNGPAILEGVKSSNKEGQIQIVCFDEEEATLQGVEEGQIFGAIVQQPYEFGYQSVRVLSELAAGNEEVVPEEETIYIPTLTVDKSNVTAFWEEMNARLGRS